MKTNKIQIKLSLIFILFFVVNLFIVDTVSSTGISADAGLTPAANRWMLRTQVRYMHRDNHPMNAQNEMKMYMHPVVVAYGLKSNITLMARQAWVKRDMTMMNMQFENSGFGDLMLMVKYKLKRINKPNYTIGIAPTIGLELPTGQDNFTSNSYDVRLGSYFSGRIHRIGMDLNVAYLINGVATTSDNTMDVGNEFSMLSALGYQISLGSEAKFSLTPVVETSYLKVLSNEQDGAIIPNTGESLVMISPGFKITWSSFIFESLMQIPVWQEQNGMQTERTTSLLVGIRLMN